MCKNKDKRYGYDVPVTAGANRIKFYDEAGEESGFRNKKYAFIPNAYHVQTYGITNIIKYTDGVSFDAGMPGVLDYAAFQTNNNKA